MSNIVNFSAFRNIKANDDNKPNGFEDATDIVNAIVDWAYYRGIDVDGDIGFMIRCTDFVSYLQMAAKNAEKNVA